jgi:hypothetical protein
MAAVFMLSLYFGFTSLYATIVCVAGSQLEKLTSAMMNIRLTHGISLQDCGSEMEEGEAAGQNTPSEQFRHMQEQMNSCISHHQQIKQ